MENMEKRAEKMETKEVEMNQRMLERLDSIDNATYCYLMQLLELSVDGAEDKFPWDIRMPWQYLKNMDTKYVIRIYPHQKWADSTVVHFPNADAKAVIARMNLWRKKDSFPISKMRLHKLEWRSWTETKTALL